MSNNSSNSKAQILSSIRTAQPLARLPAEKPGLPAKLENPSRSGSDCLNRFKQELDSLGVDYYVEDDGEAVKRRIGSLLDGKSILSWDFDYLPYDAGAVLQGRSIQFCKNDRTEQAKADIGLTGCDAAIAETGSLVLISGEGKARTASLLPFEHVAIVRRSEIYYTMGEFFEKKGKEVVAASYLNIITGPSRTADLELSLTLGVHGPGKVTVVIGP